MRPWPFLLAALGLGACALQPVPPEESAARFSARSAELARHDHWSMVGRVAVNANGEGWAASLRWRQAGEDFQINIFDTLGRTLVRLEGVPGSVILQSREGVRWAADPEQLLLEELGWELPLRGLRHWVLGLPRPEAAAADLELDGEGRPERLAQDGWVVTYPQYEAANSHSLPERLELDRDDLRIRLAVERWQLGP